MIEVARAYLYLMYNDLHSEPFGLMEDVFATSRDSRPKVHELYRRLGFSSQGRESRIDLSERTVVA